MRPNRSPWIHQLSKDRPVIHLTHDIAADIVIIGGGIAGISTAYFLLTRTKHTVVLLEGYKIAHGATGHNAGQITSYFEKSFAELVNEHGLKAAAAGQKAIEGAWRHIEEMYKTAQLNIPVSRFQGHAGLAGYDQIVNHLENNRLRVEGGLPQETVRIAEDAECLNRIPPRYRPLYTIVPRSEILSLLQTEDNRYIASLSYQKGCMNSALFVQEVLTYLQKAYKDRLRVYEYALVNKLVLRKDHILLDLGRHTVDAEKVILCTNGFDKFTIISETGLDTNTRFHHSVDGLVGYMSGYLETKNKDPIAVSYFPDEHSHSTEDPYYYLTRRPYEYEKGTQHNLICIGGPQAALEKRLGYSREADYPEEIIEEIDVFVKKTYDPDPNKKIDYIFTWHGLMGYTKNGLRMIGPDPVHPILYYNLGCNGIGILPSLHGAYRLAEIISGKKVEPSIFDVPR